MEGTGRRESREVLGKTGAVGSQQRLVQEPHAGMSPNPDSWRPTEFLMTGFSEVDR